MEDDAIICYTSCFRCNRQIRVKYYNDHFETRENTVFLHRLGRETYTYCPYCGHKETSFSPYDNQPEEIPADPVDDEFLFENDDQCEWEEWDEGESFWPEAEGAELVDDDEEDDPSEKYDDSNADSFSCPFCGEKFRVNPKGCAKIYCYYCGQGIEKE